MYASEGCRLCIGYIQWSMECWSIECLRKWSECNGMSVIKLAWVNAPVNEWMSGLVSVNLHSIWNQHMGAGKLYTLFCIPILVSCYFVQFSSKWWLYAYSFLGYRLFLDSTCLFDNYFGDMRAIWNFSKYYIFLVCSRCSVMCKFVSLEITMIHLNFKWEEPFIVDFLLWMPSKLDLYYIYTI